MGPAKQKNDPIRLLYRRLAALVLVVVLLFALSSAWGVYGKEKDSRLLRKQAERELAQLSAQEKHLASEISKLETLRGKEEVFREQYEVGREGEHLIVIVEPKTSVPIHASSTWETWVSKYLPFW